MLHFIVVDGAFSFGENTATLLSPSLEAGPRYTTFFLSLGTEDSGSRLFPVIKCLLNESLMDWKKFINPRNSAVQEQPGTLASRGLDVQVPDKVTPPHQVLSTCPSHWRQGPAACKDFQEKASLTPSDRAQKLEQGGLACSDGPAPAAFPTEGDSRVSGLHHTHG